MLAFLCSIRSKEIFKDALSIYQHLDRIQHDALENLLKEVEEGGLYEAVAMQANVIFKADILCDLFFDCKEKGFSYELGCYFQKHFDDYNNLAKIDSDITMLSHLLGVYDFQNYPEEFKYIRYAIEVLKWLYCNVRRFGMTDKEIEQEAHNIIMTD